MPPEQRRPSIATGFGKVKMLRSRFEAKGTDAQRVGVKWCGRRQKQSNTSDHASPPQRSESPDLSDNESLFDRILCSSEKELKGQSAFPTQAIKKFYESGPLVRREVGDIEPSKIQPANQGHSSLTSDSPDNSDHELETFTKHELDAIGDIVSDQPSTYAEVWTNEAHVLELSYLLGNSRIQWGAVYGVIATFVGLLPSVQDLESHVQEIEDSLSDHNFDLTPTANHDDSPGCFTPVSESVASSILADDGSCVSDGVKSHHEALIRHPSRPSLRGYALSISSSIDHTEHPAFHTRFEEEEDTTSRWADDVPCISHNTKAHKADLLEGTSARRFRAIATSLWAENDHKYPTFYSSVKQDGGNIQRTPPQISHELPALFASDEEDNGGKVVRTGTAPCSAIPDSPTLGDNLKRISWYSGSLTCSEERFLRDEAPTPAPVRFTSSSTEHEDYVGNELSSPSPFPPHRCTSLDLQASFANKGNSDLSPSQPELQDDNAYFLCDEGFEEELDATLRDDLDEWFAAGCEDEDGTEDDDTMEDGAGDQGFSDAFLSSPFFPCNDRISPRKSTILEPMPGNFAGAFIDDDTSKYNGVATSTRQDKSQVRINSFDSLRAYRQQQVQQELASPRAGIPTVPLAVESPHGVQPPTRSTTPTDREVNNYLQRTARPNTRTTPRSSGRTNQSYEPDFAVNVTPTLDLESFPERNGTFPSTFDFQPRTAPLYKRLAQKASLSVLTLKDPSPSKSPSTPTTPRTTPPTKKSRLNGSWGRKGSLPTEGRNSPCTLGGPALKDSPPFGSSSFCGTPLTQTTSPSSQSPRSPFRTIPVTQFPYLSPPQRTAPCTPLAEIPPLPPRNPRRLAHPQSPTNLVPHSYLSEMACNASFPEFQRGSMLFFNQLDQNARRFYGEQKLDQLREFTDTRVVYHNMSDPTIDYMKHPNHNRIWESRNLRCRVHAGNCSVCYVACCIHEGAEQTLKDVVTLPEEKRTARKLFSEVKMWYKSSEEPTFVDCGSCGKKVCPGCAGVCSVCLKTTCKLCDARLWQTCDTHHLN